MAYNLTIQDVLGILLVLPFFSLVLVAPGYLLGLASNVLDFRRRGLSERVLLALAISTAVSPYAINLLCRFFSVVTVSVFYLLLGVGFLARLLFEWRQSQYTVRTGTHWTKKIALCLVSAWVIVCLLSLPDMQLGQRIYSTVATYDHAVRGAFIASAMRTGAPPANPFFYAGSLIPARYYYYWNVLCALPAFLSGGNTRVTIYASCIWSGLLLAAIIPIYLKHFLEQRANLRIASLIGMALIGVTGLDLISTFVEMASRHTPPHADMEWWDPSQITSWLDSLIWVPHHVAALVACLAGYLFLWKSTCKGELPTRIWLIVLAALGFSSAAGLSVYVTFTFALFILAWVIYLLLRGKILAAVLHGAAGALAFLLSIGYIGDLLGRGIGGSAASSHFFALAPRQLPFYFIAVKQDFHVNLTYFCVWVVLALFIVFVELGIYMLVGLIQANRDWRQWRKLPEAQKALWLMAGASFAVIMCFRSTVIANNDLAYRGAMVLQFVLLLWAAVYLANRITVHCESQARGVSGQRLLDASLVALLAVGGASSLYQLCMLRVYPLLNDSYNWTNPLRMANGHEAFFIRSAYAELDRAVPASAVVQYNPETQLSNQILVYSRYQLVDAGGPDCSTEFGGSLAQCAAVQAGLQAIFDPHTGDNSSKTEVDKICQTLHVNVLVVNALDPVWKREDSWVWQDAPMIQNEFVRIYRCGSGL